MKPGYKSTEFWLSLGAALVGALLASGVFESDGITAKIIGGASAVLAALGYTAGRAFVKSADATAGAAKEIAAARGAEGDPLD